MLLECSEQRGKCSEMRDGGGMSTAGMSSKEVQGSEEDNTGGGW